MTHMGLRESFALIDACATYEELLAVARIVGRTRIAPTPRKLIFQHNGDERVCLSCGGLGEITEGRNDETEGHPEPCWRCCGVGTLP